MTYVLAADFRTASLAEYCTQLSLTDDEAETSRLTSTIASVSKEIDFWTQDHFESETTLTLDLDIDEMSPRIVLPYRCTAVTTLSTRDNGGNLIAQASTLWRLHSSLMPAGDRRISDRQLDFVEIIPTMALSQGGQVGWYTWWGNWAINSGYIWPPGVQAAQVVGTFGWTVTPADIKRAVALMVYDRYKPIADSLGRADLIQSGGAVLNFSKGTPTGIPEADEIINRYCRPVNSYLVA